MLHDPQNMIAALPAAHPARDDAARHDLLTRARAAAKQSYAPYSGFHVGAAMIDRTGRIITGANVETAQPEGTVCAERCAIMQGVAAGMAFAGTGVIDLLAVTCPDAPANAPLSDSCPCGACRQFMYDFAHPDTMILIDDRADGLLVRIHDLLPSGFRFGHAAPGTGAPADLERIEKDAQAPGADLLSLARALTANAHAPLSRQYDAALVVTASGRAYGGVQVDNSAVGPSLSALRGAMDRAAINRTSEKPDRLAKIVLARRNGASGPPLPALLQPALMLEFADENTEILWDSPAGTRTLRWGAAAIALGIDPG